MPEMHQNNLYLFYSLDFNKKNVPISNLQTIGFGFGLHHLEPSFTHCTTGLQKCHKV